MPPDATPPFRPQPSGPTPPGPTPRGYTPPGADQMRAARALLRLEQGELARRADVSVATLRRLECGEAVSGAVVDRVTLALEAAGAEFIPQGVRRRAEELRDVEARIAAIMAIADESAALFKDAPPFSDKDLYDENGLPA